MLLVLFFGYAITDLTYHAVTSKCDVRVRQAVIKKNDDYIKEVIRLYVFPMFKFTNYFGPSHTQWYVGTTSMYFLWRVA